MATGLLEVAGRRREISWQNCRAGFRSDASCQVVPERGECVATRPRTRKDREYFCEEENSPGQPQAHANQQQDFRFRVEKTQES